MRWRQLLSPVTRLVTTIFYHTNPKNFDQLSIFVNLYEHANNRAISLICFEKIVDFKILQSNWLRAFWPISSELDFSRTWSLCRNTENETKFHYRTNSGKINVRNFSINSKNLIFGPFSPIFGLKKWLCHLHMGF